MRLVVLVLALTSLAVAQPAPEVYWIVVDHTLAAPAPTPRALARRALRGTGAPSDRTVAPSARAALAALGVEVRVESRWLGAVSAALDDRQWEAVAALPFVREVRPLRRLVRADVAVPRSPVMLDYGSAAAQLALVHADDVIEAGYTGKGVRIGFLDSLYDFDHPALADIQADGRLLGVQDFIGGQQASFHGLSTSSVALGHDEGELVGPAFDAEVLAATTEFSPTETHAEEDAFVAGLEWLEANGVDVVNVSLGYSTFDAGEGDYTPDDLDGDTAIVTRAVDRAAARGVVVVTSAGNQGNTAWRFITAPADADSAIAVGAVDLNGARSSFSSVGPTADGRIKPDVAALGRSVYIARTNGAYGFSNGTSFSAPMVTGVVAQLLEANPSLTPIQVRDLLRATASQASAPDNELGWGIINATAALAALPTRIESEPSASRWRLYPSVVRPGGRVLVEASAVTELDLVDALGRQVARLGAVMGRRSVAVPDLPAGLYFVRARADVPLPALRLAIVR